MNTPDLRTELKQWRKELGITANQASNILGIPLRTLQHVEQGRPFPYPRLLLIALKSGWIYQP